MHVANLVDSLIKNRKDEVRILDYGGGTGETVKRLREKGFHQAVNYDPFHGASHPLEGVFEVVLAFEVIEHVPDPFEVFSKVIPLLREGGVFMFSTLLQPENIGSVGVSWWYVMPRNGHVSFHTADSLSLVAKRFGVSVKSLNSNCHLAIKGKS